MSKELEIIYQNVTHTCIFCYRNIWITVGNYFHSTGSLWFYSKKAARNFNADVGNIANFRSFMYKTKPVGETDS